MVSRMWYVSIGQMVDEALLLSHTTNVQLCGFNVCYSFNPVAQALLLVYVNKILSLVT